MCTASWLARPGGFELFFNRDESRTRGAAAGPRVLEVAGVRAIAPVDADAGGSWIGVNEHGVAVGLLNAWNVEVPGRASDEYRSRGLLVLDVLGSRSPAAARDAVRSAELTTYRGFRLLVVAPDERPTLLAWDGRELRESDACMPLSSSSFDAAGADRERAALLDTLRVRAGGALGADELTAFHASHLPTRGPHSPCMHREDARTVSASRVSVEPGRVRFRYAPGPPCRTEFEPAVELARQRVTG